MALIDGTYVTALTESIPYELEVTENPVEEGIALTDHAERKSLELSLDCIIVDNPNGVKAKDAFEKLQKIQNDAKIVKFVGRNIFNGIITKIEKTDSMEVANGFTCSITMKEIRIAKSPFRPDLLQAAINAGLQQMSNQNNSAVYHTVVRGDCLINIAKKYGTTLDFIIKHNKIPSGNPNLIYPGEKYLVKEGSQKAATVNQSLRWVSVAEELKLKGKSVSTKTTSTGKVVATNTQLSTATKDTLGAILNAYNTYKKNDQSRAAVIYRQAVSDVNGATTVAELNNIKNRVLAQFSALASGSSGGRGGR